MLTFFYQFPVSAAATVLAALTGLLVGSMMAGLRIRDRLRHSPDAGLGPIESSVFAVFGLLVAFTFTGAAERFTARRTMILDEAQTAQTAWDHLGLLAAPSRDSLRAMLRGYLDLKLTAYASMQNVADLDQKLEQVEAAARNLVAVGVEACRTEPGLAVAELVVPPLSRLREIGLARTSSVWYHPPAAVFVFLILLAMVCAFFAGFSLLPSAGERRLQIAGFSLVTAAALYLTLDLEFPRMGLLRVEAADEILRNVRDAMR